MRRQAMKPRVIVQAQVGSRKYSRVCSARGAEAVVDRAVDARNRALRGEARGMASDLGNFFGTYRISSFQRVSGPRYERYKG